MMILLKTHSMLNLMVDFNGFSIFLIFRNPTKGIIINHPNGNDVYKGVPHDYNGAV